MSKSFLLAALPLLATSCVIEIGDFGGVRSHRMDSLAFTPAGSIQEIYVDTFNGGVSVEIGDGPGIEGSSKVWASGSSQERADQRLAEMKWTLTDEGGGKVRAVMTRPKGGSNNCGATAALKVPVGARVLVDTSNGAVEILGDFPYAWVDTSNGHVTVRGAKEVFVDTSNGGVDVSSDGKVVVDTSNGSIAYGGASEDFFLETSNSNVEVTLAGDWDGRGIVDTSNGSISVQCAGALNAKVEADTSNGRVRIEGPEVAAPTGSLRLDSSNGSITVKHGAR